MPTAVERLLDSFLTFEDRNGEALQGAFGKIDDNLANLLNADPQSFLKLEHDHAVHQDFNLIGRTFLTIGHDFHIAAQAGALIDNFVLKGFGLNKGDTPPPEQTDFLALDGNLEETANDLRHTGLDFLKLTTAHDPAAFAARLDKIAGDFTELAGDLSAGGDSLGKLGADLIELGALPNPPSVQQELTDFGNELQTVAGQFHDLSQDFVQLSDATHTAPGNVGLAFMALTQDFHDLGAEAAKLGVGANELLNDLKGLAHPDSAVLLAGGHG
jgi:hypothetical protein